MRRYLGLNGSAKLIKACLVLIFLVFGCFFNPGEAASVKKSDSDMDIDLDLGGVLQVDYRYYQEDCRVDNRFDIRRASLFLSGCVNHLVPYRMEYEFQGNDQKKLTEAWADVVIYDRHALRIGQFKEPYSLEWQTQDKALFFAERSLGYSLTPGRDVGLMLCGSSFQARVHYAAGLFNGEGRDGSSRGSQSDEPELAARLVFTPFAAAARPFLESFQVGGSATWANIDLSNVDLEVQSSGMVGSNRSLYVLNQNTKFGVLQGVDQRQRLALEAAWAWGPLAVQGEYQNLTFTRLKPVSEAARDADFYSWYGSALFFLTGEHPRFEAGALQPVKPRADFNPDAGTWGGFCLAIRTEHFSGDNAWIRKDAFVCVRKAKAFSVALNWILNPALRLTLDYTDTDLSDSIRVRVNPDGSVDYIDSEHVLTTRFTIAF